VEFGDHAVIGARAEVDVGELRDAEAIECFRPAWEGEFFSGDGEEIGLNTGGPYSTGDADAEDAEGGASGDAFEADFFSLAGHGRMLSA
jgi:hypothetical protein